MIVLCAFCAFVGNRTYCSCLKFYKPFMAKEVRDVDRKNVDRLTSSDIQGPVKIKKLNLIQA